MPREFSRSRRVEDAIQREVSEMLQREVRDPRLARVTISAVKVSRDLTHAKLYVTFMEEGDAARDLLRALRHAAGFLRSGLAHRLQMRSVPELAFVEDVSTIRGLRVAALIEQAVTHDRQAAEERSDDNG